RVGVAGEVGGEHDECDDSRHGERPRQADRVPHAARQHQCRNEDGQTHGRVHRAVDAGQRLRRQDEPEQCAVADTPPGDEPRCASSNASGTKNTICISRWMYCSNRYGAKAYTMPPATDAPASPVSARHSTNIVNPESANAPSIAML